MSRVRTKFLASIVCSSICACGATRDVSTSPADAGLVATLELGTGRTAFEPVVNGETLQVILGPQGGYHIFGGVKATGVVPQNIQLICALSFADTDAPITTTLSVQNLSGGPDDFSQPGILCRINNDNGPQLVNSVLGQRVKMKMHIRDTNGAEADDTRQIVASNTIAPQ